MNRTLVLGFAILFAVVGIALVGGETQAVAGHGCHGCDGCSGCDGGCSGADDCCGCSGRRHRLFRRRNKCCGCSGPVNDCCAPAACGCAGGSVKGGKMDSAAPVEDAPPAPAAEASFRRVSFVR